MKTAGTIEGFIEGFEEKKQTRELRIAVVGGGAAGMMAAIAAAEEGAKVTVFDKNERAGRKLGITGKGRCNLTNDCTVNDFIGKVLRNPRFLYTAGNFFPPAAVMDYFESVLSLPLKTERGGRVFPQSDRAGDVVYALVKRMRQLGCLYLREKVTSLEISPESSSVKGVSAGGKFYPFDRVIVCTGGASYTSTGSTGDGSRMAAALGMETVPLQPSLIPLVIKEHCCKEMQGLSLRNTGLQLLDCKDSADSLSGKVLFAEQGELLFTHFGISGPTVLSASAHLPAAKSPEQSALASGRYRIVLDLKPALDEKTLDQRLQNDFSKYKNKNFINALSDLLPQKMIPVMVRRTGIPESKKVHSILREERAKLVDCLKHFSLTVVGVRSMEEAIVTRGGVSPKELDPRSMESKKYHGLYFAGEVLDIDAYTGGFNLQIAFCTGRLAGKRAAGGSL